MSLLLVAGAKLAGQPFAEPKRVAGAVAAALIATTAAVGPVSVSTTVEILTVDKWQRSFEEPVRFRPGLRAALHQSVAAPVSTATFTEYLTLDKWQQPFSEPLRTSALSAPLRYEVGRSSFFFADVRMGSWLQPFATPPPWKNNPRTAALSWQARVGADPFPGVLLDRWQMPFVEPIRNSRPLPAALRPERFFVISQTAPGQTLFATLYVDPDSFGNAVLEHVIGLSNPVFSAGLNLQRGTGVSVNGATLTKVTDFAASYTRTSGLTDAAATPGQITAPKLTLKARDKIT